ncbi:hypothetical protein M404DRAFT_1007066 [Pisolithus tinctorius Marx 270]|uniref:Uncharacterized protein n=1 Tax=Pisolithus tinctorius Marx 270 TaxID=870435 RepID=A0A0C3N4L8_PISTI|nr:hypothetical protein M404DRAFT_1007066 [Pisolithus tinctorius Marx 270]
MRSHSGHDVSQLPAFIQFTLGVPAGHAPPSSLCAAAGDDVGLRHPETVVNLS